VRDRALLKDDQIRTTGAEIDEADAEFAFIRPNTESAQARGSKMVCPHERRLY